jgi:hypothetical protein
MERRSFLKAAAALPFLRWIPAVAVAAEEEDWEEFEREARPAPLPPAGVLGVIMGQPTVLTVTVPPDRVLKITGGVFLVNGGRVAIKEGKTTLGLYQADAGQVLEAGVVVHPAMGTPTYRLECSGEVYDSPSYRPFLMVTDIA